MSRPIIIPVQTLLRIKLLTVILVRLGIAWSAKHTTERVVMVRFLQMCIRDRFFRISIDDFLLKDIEAEKRCV